MATLAERPKLCRGGRKKKKKSKREQCRANVVFLRELILESLGGFPSHPFLLTVPDRWPSSLPRQPPAMGPPTALGQRLLLSGFGALRKFPCSSNQGLKIPLGPSLGPGQGETAPLHTYTHAHAHAHTHARQQPMRGGGISHWCISHSTGAPGQLQRQVLRLLWKAKRVGADLTLGREERGLAEDPHQRKILD